jgi:hypothetical protein
MTDFFKSSAKLERQVTENHLKAAIERAVLTPDYPILLKGLRKVTETTKTIEIQNLSEFVSNVIAVFRSGKEFHHRCQLIELAYAISQEETSTLMLSEMSKCFTRTIGPECGGTPTAGRYPRWDDSMASSCDGSDVVSSYDGSDVFSS